MTEPLIRVQNLQKIYTIHEREAGLAAAVRSLVKRKTKEVRAVDDIEFTVAPGEIVGFLGPNGAGKTTTLKMLSGLLHPTDGTADVLGFTPWRREKAFLQQITLVMGQRNQLIWDIPAADSFELNRVIFKIPQAQFKQTLDELVTLLELEPLLHKPVRNLSLGERMKCEIAGALLHRPKVLFLDEPTIGLDVTAQRRIRAFVQTYNQRYGASVLLTSHYMADVEALCQRVVVIHEGRLLFDGGLSELVQQFSPYKTIVVDFEPNGHAFGAELLGSSVQIVSQVEGQVTLQVPKGETAVVTNQLLQQLAVLDLTIQDPPIDSVIDQVFTGNMEPS